MPDTEHFIGRQMVSGHQMPLAPVPPGRQYKAVDDIPSVKIARHVPPMPGNRFNPSWRDKIEKSKGSTPAGGWIAI
jgi:hypothetical protein